MHSVAWRRCNFQRQRRRTRRKWGSIHLNPSQSNSIQHVESDAQSNNAIQNHNNQSTTIQYPHPTTVSYKIQQQYPQLWQHPEAIDRTKIADGERFQTEVDIQLLPQTVWKMNEDDIVCLLQLKHQTNQNGYAIYARYETESVLFFDTVEPTDHLWHSFYYLSLFSRLKTYQYFTYYTILHTHLYIYYTHTDIWIYI